MSTLDPGTPVILPDGRQGYATPDRRLHSAWDGTYRVRVVEWLTGWDVVTVGWRREQLATGSELRDRQRL